jgi:hypothetical protein
VGSWKPEPEKPRHVHAGNKRGPRRVERGRQWARRHNLCRTAQKRPAFPSRLTRGARRRSVGSWPLVAEPDGDLSQAKAWPSSSRELAASPGTIRCWRATVPGLP